VLNLGRGRESWRPWTPASITIIAALAAAGITGYQLSRPGMLFGPTADIAVYLGAAVRLVHGAIPYRDFVLVQPPGIVLLTTPFAFLSEAIGTRDALAVLRLCTPLIAAANVVLAGRLLRHRGAAAVLIACAVMAFYPAELYALGSVILESLLALLCLAGANLVFSGDALAERRRVIAGGAAFGVAIAIKLPAVIPVLVIAVVCLNDRGRLLRFLSGACAGFAVPTLPFLIVAPRAFFHDVLATQVMRLPGSERAPLADRLSAVTGIAGHEIAIAAVLGALVIVIVAFVIVRRPVTGLERFAVLSTVAVAAAQFAPSQYYTQYAAFLAPFLALLLGTSLSRLTARALRAAVHVVAGVAVLALALQCAWFVQGESQHDVAGTVDAVVPAGTCALSDAPKYLVTSDRFVSTTPRCTSVVDPFGTQLALAGDPAAARRFWGHQFRTVDYVVTTTPVTSWYISVDPSLRAYIAEHFRLVRSGRLLFYVRSGLTPVVAGGAATQPFGRPSSSIAASTMRAGVCV